MGSKVTVPRMLLLCGLMIVVVHPLTGQEQTEGKQLLPPDGVWNLKYDFTLDNELNGKVTEFAWKLSVRNQRIAGVPVEFKEGDGGTDHRLSGEVVDGKVPVVSLRGDGPKGYVAFYIGKRVEEGRVVGTWFDTRGYSGDFELVIQKK